jgi:glc operon protein GlcG
MRMRPVLENEDIRRMAAASRAAADTNGWSVAIVIVDEAGNLQYAERTGSIEGNGCEVALAKARTAALTRQATKALEERLKDRPGFQRFLDDRRLLQVQGGLPLMSNGSCVGAIGVSGRPSADDETVAAAGVAALAG